MKPMMKCGHVANSIDGNGNPACVICVLIHPGATEIDTNPNEFWKGRTAYCAYGNHAPQPSSPNLAFFEYRGPGSRDATDICKCGYAKVAHDENRIKCKNFVERGPFETDIYYCGCRGWD